MGTGPRSLYLFFTIRQAFLTSDLHSSLSLKNMDSQLASLSRRAFLLGGVASSAGMLLGRETRGACSISSEETIGPYYVDRQLLRPDITEGKPGLRLKLRLTVIDSLHCAPVPNAALDIWHCDALGVYSGYTANSMKGGPGIPPPHGEFGGPPPGRPPGPPGPPPGFANRGATDKTTFFRGIQLTGRDGTVEFTTIYPGWYVGRDTHIHLRVRIDGVVNGSKYSGGRVCHTGQLFFPDDVGDTVAKLWPYAEHRAPRTRQDEDDVFTTQDGKGSIVSLKQMSDRSLADGMIATAVVVVDPRASPREPGFGAFGGPPPG